MTRALQMAIVAVGFAACVRAPVPAPRPPVVVSPVVVAPAPLLPAPPERVTPAPPGVDALLARMTVEEKVGQLMMVGFAGKAVDESITQLVRGYRVGGVCVFGRNIQSAAQIGKLNDEVRALLADAVPPFIAVDQEGGNVVRISDGNLVLPGNMVLGAARSPALAYEAGLAQGEDLRRLGFNMNLAPVLDVNSNPLNPVIGIRAFGDDVGLVSELGAEFV
ncbi:MAG TPA: glycoside hydrolase family 3 N-terminal domain-containing protein, partial [Archangium sp.]